jgi:hypothetical protein
MSLLVVAGLRATAVPNGSTVLCFVPAISEESLRAVIVLGTCASAVGKRALGFCFRKSFFCIGIAQRGWRSHAPWPSSACLMLSTSGGSLSPPHLLFRKSLFASFTVRSAVRLGALLAE